MTIALSFSIRPCARAAAASRVRSSMRLIQSGSSNPRRMISRIASRLATSPAAWPPMPSATIRE
jgi:hypothetical protein